MAAGRRSDGFSVRFISSAPKKHQIDALASANRLSVTPEACRYGSAHPWCDGRTRDGAAALRALPRAGKENDRPLETGPRRSRHRDTAKQG